MQELSSRCRKADARIGLALILGLCASLATAQQVIVIGDDRGGFIGERARYIEQIRAAHARIEIRGSVCYSACTMYLGVEDLCIAPQTAFGFHGPTRNGRALDAAEFDRWSGVMARYYPEPLRQWFMTTARHNLWTVTEIRGADLLRYGFEPC